MADIQGKILGKYGIDIAQENIFKLYKIEKADVSSQEIQDAIDATRKRWNQSINGANEKNAERDRARLEKADKYEAILKDDKLRKEIFNYYNKGGNQKQQAQSATTPGGIEFAREYFKLLETSKKIKKDDVEFFFTYYEAERKNKKAILEMLEKEFKVRALGKEDKYADEGAEDDVEGKKKDDNSPLIVNLFQKATVLGLRKCVDYFDKAKQSSDVCQKYPTVRESLYDFLGLKEIESLNDFNSLVTEKGKEVYQVRQEKGTDFVPLVDLFNTLKDLLGNRDVVDNITEFKLLIKYPTLTPYMYSFTEMKPGTMKGIINVANREYVFRDDVDFILNYYNPLHDNFGITNSGIGTLLKKAEKKAKANRVLNELDEKLGRKKKRKISIGAEIVHWLVYCPIFIVYFIFEVFKAIFTELHRFAIPITLLVFVGTNWIIPKVTDMGNLLDLRIIFSKAKWIPFIEKFFDMTMVNGFETVLVSLAYIVIALMVYVLPALFVWYFLISFTDDLNKRYDWMGYERTFQKIFQQLRQKTENAYIANKTQYIKDRIPKIIINIVCVLIIIAVIVFAPTAFNLISEKTGYFQ